MMVNPTTQQVVFCYMRGETDGGFYDKRAAKDLQAIFRELTKDE